MSMSVGRPVSPTVLPPAQSQVKVAQPVVSELSVQTASKPLNTQESFGAARQSVVGKTSETVNPSQGGQQIKQGIDQSDGEQLLEQGQTLMGSTVVKEEFGDGASALPKLSPPTPLPPPPPPPKVSSVSPKSGGSSITPDMLVQARQNLKPVSQHQVLNLEKADTTVTESSRSVVLKDEGSAFAPERLTAKSTLEIVGHGASDGSSIGGLNPKQLAQKLKQEGITQLAVLDLKSCYSEGFKTELEGALKEAGITVGGIRTYEGQIGISRETGKVLQGVELEQTEKHDGVLPRKSVAIVKKGAKQGIDVTQGTQRRLEMAIRLRTQRREEFLWERRNTSVSKLKGLEFVKQGQHDSARDLTLALINNNKLDDVPALTTALIQSGQFVHVQQIGEHLVSQGKYDLAQDLAIFLHQNINQPEVAFAIMATIPIDEPPEELDDEQGIPTDAADDEIAEIFSDKHIPTDEDKLRMYAEPLHSGVSFDNDVDAFIEDLAPDTLEDDISDRLLDEDESPRPVLSHDELTRLPDEFSQLIARIDSGELSSEEILSQSKEIVDKLHIACDQTEDEAEKITYLDASSTLSVRADQHYFTQQASQLRDSIGSVPLTEELREQISVTKVNLNRIYAETQDERVLDLLITLDLKESEKIYSGDSGFVASDKGFCETQAELAHQIQSLKIDVNAKSPQQLTERYAGIIRELDDLYVKGGDSAELAGIYKRLLNTCTDNAPDGSFTRREFIKQNGQPEFFYEGLRGGAPAAAPTFSAIDIAKVRTTLTAFTSKPSTLSDDFRKLIDQAPGCTSGERQANFVDIIARNGNASEKQKLLDFLTKPKFAACVKVFHDRIRDGDMHEQITTQMTIEAARKDLTAPSVFHSLDKANNKITAIQLHRLTLTMTRDLPLKGQSRAIGMKIQNTHKTAAIYYKDAKGDVHLPVGGESSKYHKALNDAFKTATSTADLAAKIYDINESFIEKPSSFAQTTPSHFDPRLTYITRKGKEFKFSVVKDHQVIKKIIEFKRNGVLNDLIDVLAGFKSSPKIPMPTKNTTQTHSLKPPVRPDTPTA